MNSNIDVTEIGRLNKDYFVTENCYKSLDNYISTARRIISKYAKRYSPTLVRTMLANEDAIANIAYALMVAETKWDKTRNVTRDGYLVMCGKWAILSWIDRHKGKPHRELLENQLDPKTDVVKEVLTNERLDLVNKIINSGVLSENEKTVIDQYYLAGKSPKTIGREMKISAVRVHQLISNAINKLRSVDYDKLQIVLS